MKKIISILIFVLVLLSACSTEAELPKVPEDQPMPEDVGTVIIEDIPEETVMDEPEEIAEEPLLDEPVVEKDPNLLSHWEFEDNAEDSAGENHGTIKGGATFTQGKAGKAISLDGVDDYVDFSQETVNSLGKLSQGTIAFWFRFESLLDTQTVMPIIYIGGKDRPDNIYVIEIGHSAGTEAPYDFNAVPGTPDPSNTRLYSTWIRNDKDPFLCFDTNKNLDENKWYHFAVVVSENGNTGYLNGVEMTDRDYNFGNSNAHPFLNDISAKDKFYIGYGRNSYMISPDMVFFKGEIDDVRVYNEPLSADEIKGLI